MERVTKCNITSAICRLDRELTTSQAGKEKNVILPFLTRNKSQCSHTSLSSNKICVCMGGCVCVGGGGCVLCVSLLFLQVTFVILDSNILYGPVYSY